MNQKAVLAVALRVVATLFFISIFNNVAEILRYLVVDDSFVVGSSKLFIVGYLSPIILKLIFSIILWFFPNMFLSKISGLPEDNLYPSAKEFLVPLIVCLGFYLVADAIIDLSYYLPIAYIGSGIEVYGEMGVSAETLAGIIACVVELGFGIWFVFGSNGLVRLLRKFRRVG